ncbi:DUF5316 domain-containing protein [Lederbergia sp. NSJ-179]|uniref:DUF5316 domain-containing protein n=1 Tax=Lederbergia sp. NSJ-179 TaxID=2931402 RepID=UPI001FD35B41|nr:DUF5316 domain-containing protein [Lederbergia sp. NSJ-179]MCJ7840130.1 DUF5316 domain-containing protein [Lederbergia sp. NSJ-179]
MNKFLSLGILLAIISLIIGFVTNDWMLVLKISGVVVLIPLLLAGLFTGALAGGDRVRANYASESRDSREERINWVKNFLFIAIPNFAFILVLLAVDYFYSL